MIELKFILAKFVIYWIYCFISYQITIKSSIKV